MRIGGILVPALGLALAGCASLIARAPAGLELDGTWTLLPSLSDEPPDAAELLREQDQELIRGRRRIDSTESGLFLTRDFPVLAAQRLDIEQDVESMGIRYDDGDYRDIIWGMHEQKSWIIRAGWNSSGLVIRSTGNGVRAVERMSLAQGGSRLVVSVTIKMTRNSFSATRVFERGNRP